MRPNQALIYDDTYKTLVLDGQEQSVLDERIFGSNYELQTPKEYKTVFKGKTVFIDDIIVPNVYNKNETGDIINNTSNILYDYICKESNVLLDKIYSESNILFDHVMTKHKVCTLIQDVDPNFIGLLY